MPEEGSSSPHKESESFPYDPDIWLKRSNTNLLLLWPELALGDAHKAELLISSTGFSATHKHDRATLLYRLFETFHQCFWLIDDREQQIFNNNKAVGEFPENAVYRRRHDMLRVTYQGSAFESSRAIMRRKYPWMRPEVLHRDVGIVAAAQETMRQTSMGRCTIRPMPDLNQATGEQPLGGDAYGIFATSDIAAKETIFVDISLFVSTSDMNERCAGCCDIVEETITNLPCCSTVFCSDQCAQGTLRLFHSAVCRRDFPRRQIANDNDLDLDHEDLSRQNLLLRVLATAVQHPSPDPFAVPVINQLTASYGGDHLSQFDFDESIVVPTAMLQDLGIDVFANQHYDTWVMQIIQARICNNRSGDTDKDTAWHAVHPLFTFFNHSCQPNAEWSNWMDKRANMLRVMAKVDIKAGQQLTISYDEDVEEMAYRERQRYLEYWMPFGCECSHCGEEKQMEREVKEEGVKVEKLEGEKVELKMAS